MGEETRPLLVDSKFLISPILSFRSPVIPNFTRRPLLPVETRTSNMSTKMVLLTSNADSVALPLPPSLLDPPRARLIQVPSVTTSKRDPLTSEDLTPIVSSFFSFLFSAFSPLLDAFRELSTSKYVMQLKKSSHSHLAHTRGNLF